MAHAMRFGLRAEGRTGKGEGDLGYSDTKWYPALPFSDCLQLTEIPQVEGCLSSQ